jgi:AraC-like DNA-binding protein
MFEFLLNIDCLTSFLFLLTEMPETKKEWMVTEPEVSGMMDTLRIETVGYLPRKQDPVDARFGFEGLGIVLKGQGRFRVANGPDREIRAPSVFFIWPGPRFQYGPDPGTMWEERCLCFSGRRVQDWLRWGWLDHPDTPMPLVQTEALVQHHRSIAMAFRPGAKQALDEAKIEIERMVLLLHRMTKESDPGDDKVIRLIGEWSESPPLRVNLHATAAKLGISYSGFRAKFLQQAGVGPYQFLLRMRIDGAARRLLAGNLPVKAVAIDAGFEHTESFCRAFQRIKGVSPGKFRARFRAFRTVGSGGE